MPRITNKVRIPVFNTLLRGVPREFFVMFAGLLENLPQCGYAEQRGYLEAAEIFHHWIRHYVDKKHPLTPLSRKGKSFYSQRWKVYRQAYELLRLGFDADLGLFSEEYRRKNQGSAFWCWAMLVCDSALTHFTTTKLTKTEYLKAGRKAIAHADGFGDDVEFASAYLFEFVRECHHAAQQSGEFCDRWDPFLRQWKKLIAEIKIQPTAILFDDELGIFPGKRTAQKLAKKNVPLEPSR